MPAANQNQARWWKGDKGYSAAGAVPPGLDVVTSYADPEHGAGHQRLFSLDALWRLVERLSEDPELEVASYRASLGELVSCEAADTLANAYGWIVFLFTIQVIYGVFSCFGDSAMFVSCSLWGIV